MTTLPLLYNVLSFFTKSGRMVTLESNASGLEKGGLISEFPSPAHVHAETTCRFYLV